MEDIISYVDDHKSAQLAALSVSAPGKAALDKAEEKLRLAGDELLRMEDEGGPPLTADETAKVDIYFKSALRIKKALLFARRLWPKILTRAIPGKSAQKSLK